MLIADAPVARTLVICVHRVNRENLRRIQCGERRRLKVQTTLMGSPGGSESFIGSLHLM